MNSIRSVHLSNFRNYLDQTCEFSETTTIIVGDNAAGKTNLLEGLYFLSSGKSFRADSDGEAIGFGGTLARITGSIAGTQQTTLEILLTTGEVHGIRTPMKRYMVNAVGKRHVDFAGHIKTVLFWPQHLDLVTHTPAIRRRYLDGVLVQTDRQYRTALLTYEKAVRQRNRLLSLIAEGKAGRNELVYWNELLIANGSYISGKREDYISFVNAFSHETLHTGIPSYEIFYDKSEISESRLLQYAQQEVAAGVTLVGPHRDSIRFLFAKKPGKPDVARFGSRGEQRLTVLWLMMAEIAFIEKETGERPILLLDDIFSELDSEHRSFVVSLFPHQQTIVTTTDIDQVSQAARKNSLLYHLPFSPVP